LYSKQQDYSFHVSKVCQEKEEEEEEEGEKR
jgi:hypothetical protein